MMRQYKRIRVRDIWVDWHPGTLARTDVPTQQEDRELREVGPPGPPEDPLLSPFPTEPTPVIPYVRQTCTLAVALEDNLLRDLPPSQWCQSFRDSTVEEFPRRFTNGRSDIIGINLRNNFISGAQQNNRSVEKPLVYTFRQTQLVNRVKFHYSYLSALAAQNWLPEDLGNYPTAAGGIVVKLFSATNALLGIVQHYGRDQPATLTHGPFDTCPKYMTIDMKFASDVPGVKKISIYFYSNHYGLSEIEAFPNYSIPVNDPLQWSANTAPPTGTLLVSNPARTATWSHERPFGAPGTEPGTQFLFGFGSFANGTYDAPVSPTGSGYAGQSGSTPMATFWGTLTNVVDIQKLVIHKVNKPDKFNPLDIKGCTMTLYDASQQVVATQLLPPVFFQHSGPATNNLYFTSTFSYVSGKTLGKDVKYLKFSFDPSNGIWEAISEFELVVN